MWLELDANCGAGLAQPSSKTTVDENIMKSDSAQTVSSWMATAEVPPEPVLAGELQTDVCIVG